MANVYEYDRRRHHQLLHHKAIFLPMFCRLSLKDINLCRRRRRDSSVSDEPSSPKVTCMGQVKRNNRITAASPAAAPAHKYSKLKKLFSARSLLPPSTAACIAAAIGGKKVCAANINVKRLKLKKDCDGGEYAKDGVIDVSELDPPLPVLKKTAPPPPPLGGDEANLWKRRFNGAALKTLQIESINLPNSKISLPPTV